MDAVVGFKKMVVVLSLNGDGLMVVSGLNEEDSGGGGRKWWFWLWCMSWRWRE